MGNEKMNFQEVAMPGREFRGVILPDPPNGGFEHVMMYVAVASPRDEFGDHGVVTLDCRTPNELRDQIDKLKDDLDWVCRGVERRLAALQAGGG